MEPLSFVASVTQLLEQGTKGVALLQKTVPPYGHFWDSLQAQLKPEHDIPWDLIESRCYLQPTFIGYALDYIAGKDAGRLAMEAHFESFVQPPEGAREDRETILKLINEAAAVAAHKAAPDDRRADLANRQLITGRLLAAMSGLGGQIGEVQAEVVTQAEQTRELVQSEIADLKDELAAQSQTAPSPTLPNEEWVQRAAEQAAQKFLDTVTSEIRQATPPEPEPGPAPERQPTLPTDPGVEAVSQQEHLDRLREQDPAGAAQIEALVEADGVLGLATAIRDGQLKESGIPTLLAAARIVAKSGFHGESEQAYLRASELAEDTQTVARHLVRAARMARVAGSDDRYARHLAAARRACPESPAVAIAEARDSDDSAFMLERLAGVETDDDDERASLHQTRAQAHLGRGDETQAERELDLARQARPENLSVREFEAILQWSKAQRQVANGGMPDADALLQAAERFASLASGLVREKRFDEAALIAARAAESFMLTGDAERAEEVLRALPDPALLKDQTALTVAEAALMASQLDLVLAYASADSPDPYAKLFRAEAIALGAAGPDRTEAVDQLIDLMSNDDEQISRRAAFALLVASSDDEAVEWNEEAERIITAHKPGAAAGMRAERAAMLGNYAEAERLMRPHAQSVHMRRRLRDYAAQAGQWDKVADQSRELFRVTGAPEDRLAFADALGHLGRPADAVREFLQVGRDANARAWLRERAYGGAMEIVGRDRDYPAIRELAADWYAQLPESDNALWNLLFAHARLGDHGAALKLAVEQGAVADNEQRAVLLAEIYFRAAPRAQALRRLIELSDQFDRKVEALEGMLIAATLDVDEGDVERDPDVAARVKDTLATFQERFPDQQTMISLPAPETAEELVAMLAELAGDRPKVQAQMADAVRDGLGPVNAFAVAGPDGLAATWDGLFIWPLGFAMADRDQADRQAAHEALGAAAVWDTSALVVASYLTDLTPRLVAALPGSLIANETFDDADAGVALGGKRVAQTVHDASGEVLIREIDEEERQRDAQRARAVLELAKRAMEMRPALGEGVSEQLCQRYREIPDDRRELKALVGTLALAQRSGRPVFSDDRWVREAARQDGLSAFGTLALLDVLREDEIITADEHRAARWSLTEHGAWGVTLTADELTAAGEAGGFGEARLMVGALHDRAAWRAQPADRMLAFASFLAEVYARRPDQFGAWVRRILEAAQRAASHMPPEWFVEVMLVMLWQPVDDELVLPDACFQQLVQELKGLPTHLTSPGYDPVLASLEQIMGHVTDAPEEHQALVFSLAIQRLSPADQERMKHRDA